MHSEVLYLRAFDFLRLHRTDGLTLLKSGTNYHRVSSQREEQMRKEMERQDRERRKEEQRMIREQQRQEEKFQREERREMERREKFMQKELLRVCLNFIQFLLFASL